MCVIFLYVCDVFLYVCDVFLYVWWFIVKKNTKLCVKQILFQCQIHLIWYGVPCPTFLLVFHIKLRYILFVFYNDQ
jgi:hypothetical protein